MFFFTLSTAASFAYKADKPESAYVSGLRNALREHNAEARKRHEDRGASLSRGPAVNAPPTSPSRKRSFCVRLLFVAADSLDRGTPHDLRVARAATEAYERIEANVRDRARTRRLHIVQGIA